MSLNTLILTGNLGGDPRFTVNTTGRKKASFSIASTKSLKGADGRVQRGRSLSFVQWLGIEGLKLGLWQNVMGGSQTLPVVA